MNVDQLYFVKEPDHRTSPRGCNLVCCCVVIFIVMFVCVDSYLPTLLLLNILSCAAKSAAAISRPDLE